MNVKSPITSLHRKTMKININDSVTVKLTEAGEKHLRDYDQVATEVELDWGTGLPGNNSRVFKTQLWELMNIFGPEMYMGNPNIMFEGNTINVGEDEPLRSS